MCPKCHLLPPKRAEGEERGKKESVFQADAQIPLSRGLDSAKMDASARYFYFVLNPL